MSTRASLKATNQGGPFILQADIEGQVSCSVSARNGLSLKDVLSEKLVNTGGRKWSNFEVYTKWTREHIEWEMNVSCVRGHALIVVNKMDPAPVTLPGSHHFLHTDMISVAAQPHLNKDFCYIIRPSGQNPGGYALAITTPTVPNGTSSLRHVKIGFDNQRESGKFTLCSKDFDDLDSLIAFFKSTPIKAHNGPNMYLRYPVPVDSALAEDCKQRCRLTRSGERYDWDARSDVDSFDNLSLRSYGTPSAVSLSYDGSISELSTDDERAQYLPSPMGSDPRHPHTSNGRQRGSTVISNTDIPFRDQTPYALDNTASQYSHDIYYNDVMMRAQSTSSSGTTSSGRTTSSTNSGDGDKRKKQSVEEPESLMLSLPDQSAKSPRSGFATLFKRNTPKKITTAQRPKSEIIQQQHRVDMGSRCHSASPNVSNFEVQPGSPDEAYMVMTPRSTHSQHVSSTTLPVNISLNNELRMRFSEAPAAVHEHEEDGNSRTLTRLQFSEAAEEPEDNYVMMTPNMVSPSPTVEHMRLAVSDPTDTYVTMVASPRHESPVPRDPSQSECPLYANNDRQPLYQNIQRQGGNTMNTAGLDSVTANKLITNVQELMATVKQQSADIRSLKMTVKDLKLKVDDLLRITNPEEFDYEYDQ